MPMRISFFFLFKLAVLLMFLDSMHLWVTWNIPTHYIGVIVFSVMISYVILTGVKLRVSFKRGIGAVLLITAFLLGYNLNSLGAVLGPVFTVLPCLLLLFISDSKILLDTFNFIVNFFAILLPISLFVFLLTFIGLPRIGEITHFSDLYGTFDNYILAFRSNMYGFRFSSVFLEPGHLGMILSFLLFALKYNFKDFRVVILLIVSLFTLSLAAYVLIFIGYILKLLLYRELRFRVVLLGSVSLLLLYLLAVNFNEGDNLLNNHLFARLQLDEEKGFTGNNRTYGKLDDVFEIAMNNKELVFWGIGVDNYNLLRDNIHFGGAGVKVYVLRQGLVSVLLVFSAYFLVGLSLSKHRRYILCFMLLIALSFWQRAYPFWTSWIITFMGGIALTNEIRPKEVEK
jgi:hypothetical protein